jgi:phytoene/squalene synthetase
MASFKLTIPLSYLFFKIFSSVYGGSSLIAKLRRPHADFFFPWEMRLPFVPSWALVYLTVPLLLLLTPFILRTWRSFTPFMLTLTIETLIAGVFFLGMPLAQAYPARIAHGFFGSVFHLADRLNLDYNKFPSLHIAFAVTAAIVFGRRCGWFGRGVLTVWLAAVFASTLLIHEHQLLDLAGGLALGLAGSFAILRRMSQEAMLESLRIEALCLSEFWGLVRRHPRYLRIFFALFRASLPGWRRRRPLRVAYCLAQHVDDVLDGDRPAGPAPADSGPEAYVRSLLAILAGGPMSRPAEEAPVAELLAAYLATALAPAEKAELRELCEVLIEDRRRMDGRRTMASPALAEHHRRTFHLAVDLALRLSGSRLHAADAPELVEALAWSSPVRDLDEDLGKGLINVPAEVIAEAGWTGREENLEPILDTPAVVEGLRGPHRRRPASILALGERLPSLDDRRGRKILAAFRRVLAAYERKYRRRHPDLTEPPAGLAPAPPPLMTRRPRAAGRRG